MKTFWSFRFRFRLASYFAYDSVFRFPRNLKAPSTSDSLSAYDSDAGVNQPLCPSKARPWHTWEKWQPYPSADSNTSVIGSVEHGRQNDKRKPVTPVNCCIYTKEDDKL